MTYELRLESWTALDRSFNNMHCEPFANWKVSCCQLFNVIARCAIVIQHDLAARGREVDPELFRTS